MINFSNSQCGFRKGFNAQHRLITVIEKLTPYLYQNDLAFYFEPYWKRENAADINFWY